MRITATRRWRRWVYRGLLGVAVLGPLAFLTISWQIGSDVHAAGAMAVREYGGDRISALIAYADSPSHRLRDRNRAVWALGHIGDPRALPFLEKHYTGKPCDHDRMLCQRELGTAIRLCRGGVNLPALVWRHKAVFGEEAP
jgi:hypothetical protein